MLKDPECAARYEESMRAQADSPVVMYDLNFTIKNEPKVATLEVIQALERELAKFPQVECPVEHFFADGLYARKILMPADTVVTSKYHKTNHFAVILRGEVDVWEPGGPKVRHVAPAFFMTKAGTKRVLHTSTETEWVTFHATEHKDVAKIEADIIDPEMSMLPGEVA